jgi:hypothetical protein
MKRYIINRKKQKNFIFFMILWQSLFDNYDSSLLKRTSSLPYHTPKTHLPKGALLPTTLLKHIFLKEPSSLPYSKNTSS